MFFYFGVFLIFFFSPMAEKSLCFGFILMCHTHLWLFFIFCIMRVDRIKNE